MTEKEVLLMNGLLRRAALNSETLEMIYQNNKGVISHRVIKIIKLNDETFCAYCFTRKKQRTFKLTNVLSIGPVRKIKRGA
jgi:predicted DNA-binding transcriptional regulator YafY